jgi:hypothetical protein
MRSLSNARRVFSMGRGYARIRARLCPLVDDLRRFDRDRSFHSVDTDVTGVASRARRHRR